MNIQNNGVLFQSWTDDALQPLTDAVLDKWTEYAAQFADECEWLTAKQAPTCLNTVSLPIGIPVELTYRFKKQKGVMRLDGIRRLPDDSIILAEGGLAGLPADWQAQDVDDFIVETVQEALPVSMSVAKFLKTMKRISPDNFRYLRDHLEDLSVRTESSLILSTILAFPAWTEAFIEDEAVRRMTTAQANELAGTSGLLRAEALAHASETVDYGRDAAGIMQAFEANHAKPMLYLYGEALLADGEEHPSVPTAFYRDLAFSQMMHMQNMLADADLDDLEEGEQVDFVIPPHKRRLIVPFGGTYNSAYGCASLPWFAHGHEMDLATESFNDALDYAMSYDNGFIEDCNGMVCSSESIILWRAATFTVNNLFGTGSDVRFYK